MQSLMHKEASAKVQVMRAACRVHYVLCDESGDVQICLTEVVVGQLPEAALKGIFFGQGSMEPPYHLIYWDPNQRLPFKGS